MPPPLLSPDKHTQIWRMLRGPFLFPQRFAGHKCEWERFSYNQAGCLLCGAEHRCPMEDECDQVQDDDGHIICTITACVIREQHHKDEWGAVDRACIESKQAAQGAPGIPSTPHKTINPSDMWDFVHHVVRELLDSETTTNCRQQECKRLIVAQMNAMQKEIKRNRERGWINLLHTTAEIAWATRKLRRPVALPPDQLNHIINVCTDSITRVMLKYNNLHVSKILHNEGRKREFACSMLYLMRNGVDCRGEAILPKIPIMASILPLESFLPDSFRIRPKSITEGENFLKIEIRHMLQL